MMKRLLFLLLLPLLVSCKNHIDNSKEKEVPLNFIKKKENINLTLLYGVWAYDITDPHAVFSIDEKEFFIVDSDHLGNSKTYAYVVKENTLELEDENLIKSIRIISLTKDSLKIKWNDNEEMTRYVRFPQN
ncbi:exported hypothetical protein [Tenacibaculum sp. 190524A05c]|uniref:hypothetical protein n=1 Tax=Tenacibaculum platacis TaxID=3137852 RepID=UPI0031FB1849